MDYTIDDFLGGKIRLKQGDYRATSDAVLLASAVPVKDNQTVLDVGCGTGAVALCIKARVPKAQITGIEIQQEMANLACENAHLNSMEFEVVNADVLNPPKTWKERQFHHVVTNPPYFSETPQRDNKITAIAHAQQVPLSKWLDFCIKKVRAKGTLTIIHRTQAVPEILSILNGRMGKITLIPLWPKDGVPPKRVIIQATMNLKSAFVLHQGIVLHNADNTRTQQTEEIMRQAKALF
ncbi:MAG: methyltransferase domain-containing protein [Alphaproteobacteria bacterium]|nr:methyltransferase domain-containing protein [Alphaproteobacteria bacterium]